eukprot:GHVN01083792.1.p1 GENE.GHVN01083792.1~~GHVN01083792.1.p1  ORF type:complete len:112 (+),score=9.01 GHVN01083792.1:146-481(+)
MLEMIAMSAWKAMFLVVCCSVATISRAVPPCLRQKNEDGFGDSMNKHTSMATFKGGLGLNTQFWNKPEDIDGLEDPRDLHRLISEILTGRNMALLRPVLDKNNQHRFRKQE